MKDISRQLEQLRQVRDVDARAMEILRRRGEPFTVPAFCRAWLLAIAQSPYRTLK